MRKKIVVVVKDSMLVEYGAELAKEKVIDAIMETLQKDDFVHYLGKRMSDAIINIAFEQTGNIGSDVVSSEEVNTYLSSFNAEINDNTIYIYNDSVIDTSTKIINNKDWRDGYPFQLSLAKLIEYGFGYTGSLYSNDSVPQEWEYDVHKHGYKGWYYLDNSGQAHWTNGLEGRYVFLKLCLWLEKNFADIVNRYLKNNL